MRQDYYTGLSPFLERRYGSRDDLALTIMAPQVPVSDSAAARGEQLKEAIRIQLQDMPLETRVHIIAHSMGGLVARWVIAEGSLSDRIDSLITIATPHRNGTPQPSRAARNGRARASGHGPGGRCHRDPLR